MGVFCHRTTFQVLRSQSPNTLPEPITNYVSEPDLIPVAKEPDKYWVLTGDVFSVMDRAAKTAVDDALLVISRDSIADEIDEPETYSRGFALLVLEELNVISNKVNLILDAINASNDLTEVKTAIAKITKRQEETSVQQKTALRNKLDI